MHEDRSLAAARLADVRNLVREGEVHRDVYTDPAVFDLEMEQVFGNTWVYVGHASQVPNTADFITTTYRRKAGGHGPAQRRQHPGAAQPLPAQGHAGRQRNVRQCRAVLPLPLSCVELPHRRQHRGDPAAGRATTRTAFSRAMRRRACAGRTCTSTAISCSPAWRRHGHRLRGVFRRKPRRAWTTWSTVRRSENSKSPAACCAICTAATGRCWSRT